jgi:hypothetical protein
MTSRSRWHYTQEAAVVGVGWLSFWLFYHFTKEVLWEYQAYVVQMPQRTSEDFWSNQQPAVANHPRKGRRIQ